MILLNSGGSISCGALSNSVISPNSVLISSKILRAVSSLQPINLAAVADSSAELSATAARLIGCSEDTARNILEEISTELGEITELDSAPQEMLPPEFKRIIKVTAEGKLYYVGIGKGDEADEYYVGNIVSSDGVLIKSLIK